ncbi:DUF2059 domain-containing protein [Mangrovimonas sp. AS39]|uniref:DUF2059 domain-containing protein n=1 Tax=Mangrovimonas TaxID=1211036 RepID=UPI0006B52920|nr:MULTISPECIES: DUF2059 domain-containing protein [Mangrovimonas]MCF1190301.1 DUF2059 domain-containing protein [Mangrovimonas futianensis]MCF1193946.1 DUF2059 domain-containing protein [Mangrovimonas futianensis]MCF1420943.1 DUF2059 domain-containing protein [Mangrovimonas futianensis]
MKNLFFVLALVFSISLQAQEDASLKSQTIQLIKATGATQMFEDVITQIGNMVPEDKKPDYLKEAKGTLDQLYTDLAQVYMNEFSEEEIVELNKFYQTELGKKLSASQSKLSQKGMVIGQSWGMKLQQIAQKYM